MKKTCFALVIAFVLIFTLPGCSSAGIWEVLASAAQKPSGTCGGVTYELTGDYGTATFKDCADDIAVFSDSNGNPIIMELTINKLSAVVGYYINVNAAAYELDHKGTVTYKPACAITSPDTRRVSDDGSYVYSDTTSFQAVNDIEIDASCSFPASSDAWSNTYSINATASLSVYPTQVKAASNCVYYYNAEWPAEDSGCR